MSKLIFKPNDFNWGKCSADQATFWAQSIFDKWLAEQKVVYITDDKHGNFFGGYRKNDTDSYKAYLVNIEPIEQCKHEPEKINLGCNINIKISGCDSTHRFVCECGVTVKPKLYESI